MLRRAISQQTDYRLDKEQCERIRDCLRKARIALPPDRFARFARDIEASIGRFCATPPEGTPRAAHDALRTLWQLAHDDDPPIAVLRGRLQCLPLQAREYVGRRVPNVIPRFFRGESIGDGLPERAYGWFLDWATTADSEKLVTALRVLTANGAVIVPGRSRGGGKRSRARIEPIIAGAARGEANPKNRGGRPNETARRDLVMDLALDWLTATDAEPSPGRSDAAGFGDLVHSIFQWLAPSKASGETATYALRQYWDEVRRAKVAPSLRDFRERYRQCDDCRWLKNRPVAAPADPFCVRLQLPCDDARKPDAACGPGGALFELYWPEG